MPNSGLKSSPPPVLPDDAPHLLVIDDDRRIRDLLQRYLTEHGYRITTSETASLARDKLASLTFDLLILDVMLPGESGLALAKSLRTAENSQNQNVPILMLTAKAEIEDRLLGLETGVDDYLTKPFEPRELLLRIASILRRSQSEPAPPMKTQPESVQFGPFQFDLGRGLLTKHNEPMRLTDREIEILRLLAEQRGSPLPREALVSANSANADASQNDGAIGNERSIDVQINRLRRKLEDNPAMPLYLQTVRGAGYRLVLD